MTHQQVQTSKVNDSRGLAKASAEVSADVLRHEIMLPPGVVFESRRTKMCQQLCTAVATNSGWMGVGVSERTGTRTCTISEAAATTDDMYSH